MIYCNRKLQANTTSDPSQYIHSVTDMSQKLVNGTEEDADVEENIKVANDLKTDLRTQPIEYGVRFISSKGLECLLNFLIQMNADVRQSHLHFIMIGCIRSLMNNPKCRAHILAHPVGIKIIAQSMKTGNEKVKIQVLEILGAVSLVPGGHNKVLEAMDEYKDFAGERTRFQTIMMDLYLSFEGGQDPSALQIAIMSFINALINFKAGEESLEMRLHLRYEFLMLGIEPCIYKLRALNLRDINNHLDIFDLVRGDDERDIATRLGIPDLVPGSTNSVVGAIVERTKFSPAQDHLRSALYHLCLLPIDDIYFSKYFLLVDRLVQQVVLQQDKGYDPDTALLKMNVEKLVFELVQEEKLLAMKNEIAELKEAREDLRVKLGARDRELETVRKENDNTRVELETLKVKADRLTAELAESQSREREFSVQNNDLRFKLEEILKGKDIKMEDLPAAPAPNQTHPNLSLIHI